MTDPLRRAAEMALKVLEHSLGYSKEAQARISEAKQALRQALSQPEQEFVGACVTCGAPKNEWLVDNVNTSEKRAYKADKCIHEPVAIVNEGMGGIEWLSKPLPDDTPLYVAPPKREWVGLTDDDIAQAMFRSDAIFTGPMQFKFAQAIEAKLKEKNT